MSSCPMCSCPIEIVASLQLSRATNLHVVKIDDKLVAVSETCTCMYGRPSVSTSIAQLLNYSDPIVSEMRKDLNGQS